MTQLKRLVFLLVSMPNCDTAQALVFLLVSVCCDTAQALVFLLVSVCCGTARVSVFLLVSVCCDTSKPWCSCWCQCVVTQPEPWCFWRRATHGLWVGGAEDDVDDPLWLNLSLGIGVAGEQHSSRFLFKQCFELDLYMSAGFTSPHPTPSTHPPILRPHHPSTPLAPLFFFSPVLLRLLSRPR